MVLYKRGEEKYFDPYLLQCLKNKESNEVFNIFKGYYLNEFSPELRLSKDDSQATVLHYAAQYGVTEIVRYLLHHNCEIDAQDLLGSSPLMLAVTGEHVEVVDLLLEANANIHLRDSQGKSALQMIFEVEATRYTMLRALFRHATCDKIIEGITPNDFAEKLKEFGHMPMDVLHWKNVDLMKFLLSRDGTIGARKYDSGKTLLHKAVEMGLMKMAKVLIDFGADVNALDGQNATPLFYLGNVGSSDESGDSLKVLEVLLSRATSPTASNAFGSMQISNALHGDESIVEMILRFVNDLSAADDKGNSILHYLARNSSIDLFKLLRGRRFDVKARNTFGFTPLHVAAHWKSSGAVQFLLESGADVNAVNKSGETALYLAFACFYGSANARSVEMLLQYGADPQTYVRNTNSRDFCTIFDLIVRSSVEDQGVMMLACLAIIEGLGTEVTELTRSKIQMKRSWMEYIDECRGQLERMKKTTVYGNVTLFQCLAASQRKAAAYVRNEELVAELEKVIKSFDTDSPYSDLIQKRFAEAMRLSDLRQKAVAAICRLIDLKNNAFYFIAENTVDYLTIWDMEILHLVWNE